MIYKFLKYYFFSFGKLMKFKNNSKNYLSNLYQISFKDTIYSNLEFKSMEHYFYSMKYFIPKSNNFHMHVKNIRKIKDSNDVTTYSKAYPYMCSNFCNIKDKVMKDGLILKFYQNPELRKKLVNTKGSILVEMEDSYWGIGKDKNGQNKLGLLLEQVRDELKF
jgi:N-glycosidase YbiA